MTRQSEAAPSTDASSAGGGSLSTAAASGTGWTTAQGLINKVATMVATYIVSLKLSPDEFGMAMLVVAIGGFLIVLPPLVMGDVLITHQRRFQTMVRTAGGMVLWIGIGTTLLVAAMAPLIALFYPNYAFGTLVGLIIVVSFRPTGDAVAVVPLSRMRIDLRYRAIALIDGTVQMAATIATVVLAFLGAGALSLVLPQVAAIIAKAVCYRSTAAATAHARDPRPAQRSVLRGRMMREFTAAGSAQYIHTLLGWVPVLVLGKLCSEAETGFFGFAFLLANQATFVISYQLGTVLQPIFGRLKHEPARQAAGFLRVVRAIGALAVPVSFLQAALAWPLFLLVFEPKWHGAAPVFAVLCVGQAFYFAMAPAMALLKAQGRFRTFFVWQAVQLVVSAALYPLSALAGNALGVAICDTVLWGISVPVAVWLGTRMAGGGLRGAVAVFIAPWSTAVPIAGMAYGAWYLLEPLGTAGMVISLFVVGPVALALSIWATRFSQPATYAEMRPMVAKVTSKVSRLPRSMLSRLAR